METSDMAIKVTKASKITCEALRETGDRNRGHWETEMNSGEIW